MVKDSHMSIVNCNSSVTERVLMATKVFGNLGGAGRMAGALDPGSCCCSCLTDRHFFLFEHLLDFGLAMASTDGLDQVEGTLTA